MGFDYFLWDAITQVSTAMIPLGAALLLAQLLLLRMPAREFWFTVLGLCLVYIGLVLFLAGVSYGISPIATELGFRALRLYGVLPVTAIAVVLGFCTALAEPSLRVMSEHVQNTTTGSIPAAVITYAVVTGVALFTGVAVLRTLFDVPLLLVLGPAYGACLLLALAAERRFVSIAFDAGGVVTGPMIVAFLVAFVAGVSNELVGAAEIGDAFGVVALVALAPILSLLVVGVLFRIKGGRGG